MALDIPTLRQRLVTAVQYEIIRGLVEDELDLPRKRLEDYRWLANNASINNQNLRGDTIAYLAGFICAIDDGNV